MIGTTMAAVLVLPLLSPPVWSCVAGGFLVFGEPLAVLWPGLGVWVVFVVVEVVGGTYTPAIPKNKGIWELAGGSRHTSNKCNGWLHLGKCNAQL